MLNPAVSALFGALSLFFGRRLFWLFIIVIGFAAGFTIADRFLAHGALWLELLVGLLGGVTGALLALVAQRLAIAVAGFFAGAYLFLAVSGALGGGHGGLVDTIALILGGVLGALLLSALFDIGLIVASAAVGGILIAQVAATAYDLSNLLARVVAIMLAVVGIIVQWTAWQRAEHGQERKPVD
jgi:hypothetical protein